MSRQAAVTPHTSINYKLVAVLALGAVFVGGIIVAARPGSTVSAAPAPVGAETRISRDLSAKEANFDFGSVSMAAGKVTHRYWIRNSGDAPVVVRKIYTSCMCTTAALVKGGRKFAPAGMPGHGFLPTLNEAISPKEAAMIEVVFDPAAHGPAGVGRVERVVTIETDREAPLQLGFVATVTP